MNILGVMNFSQFLEMKFLEWQQQAGGRKTVKEFAEWLGFGQSTVSTWMNETRTPQGDNIRQIAAKLGPEVYDALGLERPDPDLTWLQQVWTSLPRVLRKDTRTELEQILDALNDLDLDEQAELLAYIRKQKGELKLRKKPIK